MHTGSFIIYIKTEDFYKGSANVVEKQSHTPSYDEDDKRPLLVGMNKKLIGLFKDELGGKIIKELVAPRAKDIHT